jgi:arylsulfatase
MNQSQPQPHAQSRPNIILLTTDQQRGDCIAIDENAPACLQTPNLDALAGHGARFRRGYSECPSCIPARRSLMTGAAPAAHGMVAMLGLPFNPPHTLAGELQKSGYQTFLSGKLHLHPRGKRFGFEQQALTDTSSTVDDAYGRFLLHQHHRPETDLGGAHGIESNGFVSIPTHFPTEQTHTYFCVSQAIEYLKVHRDPTAPFFMNLSLVDPHPPFAPPQSYYDRYINRSLPDPPIGDWVAPWPDNKPVKGLKTDAWRTKLDEYSMQCCRAGYYAAINFVDDQIGRFINFLKRNQLWENTWILFTSDHGEMLGDHHLFRKTFAYEGSARVPFFIHAPKSAAISPLVSDCPVGMQDVMPTLLDIAGLPTPPACTGKSLLPILRRQTTSVRDCLHGEHAGQYSYDMGVHYLVGDRYKYIWYSQSGVEHLFDLTSDANETKDLTRTSDASTLLGPWRDRLTAVLNDRPEGFVKEGRLTPGAPHKHVVPNHPAAQFTAFL